MMSLHDPEAMLFDAIFCGNVFKVKQLINSGINKNTVLHSPIRWEGATVLGTAAYSGNIEIVKFLLDVGTSINFQDPCLSRNALHWASMGPGSNVVKYLSECGADVNCSDRDNMTPLLQAAMNRHSESVCILVQQGADVDQMDRLRCSALHYSSINGDQKSITAVIKGGCILNNPAIFGRGTVLANLVYHKDYYNCYLLLEAGYNFSKDDWINTIDDNQGNEITDMIKLYKSSPMSLKSLSRYVIRTRLKPSLQKKVSKLPIPKRLQNYIMLR
ncbi:histone-lysine N-methyltransferase EHMT2 isoform X2 [Patella vulgata]|nr:histone-lysine N-methyltransferase EHMT2 isoform X2 [Patella vulgata]